MKFRHQVLALLTSLSVLTYLDRVCISVAGPRLQNDLHLGPQEWGWVTGAFAVAYALFEIPSGYLSDRFGARAMLTRIVLWWSAFTALTGFATNLWSLLLVRFLFGAGEAGAYPTASTSVFRWFPAAERGRAFGAVIMASQLGGAVAPLLIVPIQMHYGWRVSFYLFGFAGVIWSVVWWRVYRNRPAEKAGITDAEIAEIGGELNSSAHEIGRSKLEGLRSAHEFPWKALAASRNIWAIMGSACAYLYSYYFFLFWLPTYMIRSRGFTESETKLSALPFVLGAAATLAGGFARDAAVRRFGQTWGARIVCQLGLSVSAAAALAAVFSSNRYLALTWLAICYGGIAFQQPAVFATCIDIGKRYAGAVTGCMNSAAAFGGLMSSGIFGYLVQRSGNYDAVLLSMAGALLAGAALWFLIDAAKPVRVS